MLMCRGKMIHVVVEGRRPYYWSCGASGYMSKACPDKKAAPHPSQAATAEVSGKALMVVGERLPGRNGSQQDLSPLQKKVSQQQQQQPRKGQRRKRSAICCPRFQKDCNKKGNNSSPSKKSSSNNKITNSNKITNNMTNNNMINNNCRNINCRNNSKVARILRKCPPPRCCLLKRKRRNSSRRKSESDEGGRRGTWTKPGPIPSMPRQWKLIMLHQNQGAP